MQETWVWSLGWEDPLEQEMVTHSSIFTERITWTEEPCGLQSMGSQRVGHDWATNTNTSLVYSQFSHSVMSDSLRLHGLKHTRLPCPYQLLELTQTHVHWVSDAIHPTISSSVVRPLLLPPSILPITRVFSNESVLHIRWPKYWSFSFSISPSSEYSGLISFRMDWLDLLKDR